MCTCCKDEFQLRRFGFSDNKASHFQKFLWFEWKLPFLAYRTVTLLFHLGWLISNVISFRKIEQLFYLSNWCMLFPTIYYAFAWISSVESLKKKKPLGSIHGYENKAAVQATPTTNQNVESDVPRTSDKGLLKWFHKFTWVFHTISIDLVLLVTIVYWAVIFPSEDPETRDIYGIFKHGINFAVLFVDMFLVSTQVRILHAVYGILAGSVYSIFLVVIYFVGFERPVYGFLNFKTNPGLSAGILIALSFVGIFICHIFWFGAYRLRSRIHRMCKEKEREFKCEVVL